MIDAATLEAVVAHLADDGFIAYPTETVWGLGACADRPRAIERILDWKGRSAEMPMSVLVTELGDAAHLGCKVTESATDLAAAFWPGPVTLIVPREPGRQRFAAGIAGAGNALGLRCSTHPLAIALAAALATAGLGPLTSTSFNRTGNPPATNFAAASALAVTAGESDAPLCVGDVHSDAGGEMPSTVVDCTGAEPKILREGAVSRDAILSAAQQERHA